MQLNQMRVEKPNVAQLNPSQTLPNSVVLISIKIAGLITKNIWATKVMMPAINNHGPFAVFLKRFKMQNTKLATKRRKPSTEHALPPAKASGA